MAYAGDILADFRSSWDAAFIMVDSANQVGVYLPQHSR